MTLQPQSPIAIGMDIVSISRVSQILSEYPDRFRDLAFTEAEQNYCENQAQPAQHYAARWAIKESYLKATNPNHTVNFTDVEVSRDSGVGISLGKSAREALVVASNERNACKERTGMDITMSHDEYLDCATGIVIIFFGTYNGRSSTE